MILSALFMCGAYPFGSAFGYVGGVVVLHWAFGGVWHLDYGFTTPEVNAIVNALSVGWGVVAAVLVFALTVKLRRDGPNSEESVWTLALSAVGGVLGTWALIVYTVFSVVLLSWPPG